MPDIFYMIGTKMHKYYPDIYIPNENLIIEVKSTYTISQNLEMNQAKFEATKKL
jgi:hypothetical protein